MVHKVYQACNIQHTYQDKGDLLFRTGLSTCPNFCNLGIGDRANMIQTTGWVTKGRLRKGIYGILGVHKLPILLPDTQLAYLLMQQDHEEDHKDPKITLWRSRSNAWVVRGKRLANKVEREGDICKARKLELVQQQTGDLTLERFSVGSKPFTWICLGPTVVKAMVNKRGTMKVWPLDWGGPSTG